MRLRQKNIWLRFSLINWKRKKSTTNFLKIYMKNKNGVHLGKNNSEKITKWTLFLPKELKRTVFVMKPNSLAWGYVRHVGVWLNFWLSQSCCFLWLDSVLHEHFAHNAVFIWFDLQYKSCRESFKLQVKFWITQIKTVLKKLWSVKKPYLLKFWEHIST